MYEYILRADHWHVLLWGRLFLGLLVFLSLRLGSRPSVSSTIHINVFIVAILVLVLFREPILIVLDQGHSVTLENIKSFPKAFKCLGTLERASIGIWNSTGHSFLHLDHQVPSIMIFWQSCGHDLLTSLPVTTTVLCTK